MAKLQVTPPKIPPRGGLEPADVRFLKTDTSLEQVSITGDASGIIAKNLRLDEVLLERVNIMEAKLEKMGLSDVIIKGCDLSAARAPESSLIRIHVWGGRASAIDLSRSVLKDVTFEDCKMDMANFRFGTLARVRFVGCTLTDADFQGAELHDVIFEDCHLERVEFSAVRARNLNVPGSQLIDLRGWRSLKGLTLDSAQLMAVAPQLALALGMKLKD
jgi:uncharacterized protein YjbI with pentapeptide repeats